MKKTYFLAVAIFAFTFSVNAQFTEDFDALNLGSIGEQSPHFDTWTGNPNTGEDLTVSDFEAQSGFQSGYIGMGQGPQDAMLLMGNKDSSDWTLKFAMYIPTGKTGYFNIQGLTAANGGAGGTGGVGVFNSPNLVFNNTQSANGAPGLGGAYPVVTDADATYTWVYPEATWFDVLIYFDTATKLWTMTIDGVAIAAQPFDKDAIVGALDLFAIDANNEYYIDDVLFIEGILSTNDFAEKGFMAYPNPVEGRLNLSAKEAISSVSVYNVLGQEIYNANVNALRTSIDTSSFSSGAYFVKVNIGGTEGTIKVIK